MSITNLNLSESYLARKKRTEWWAKERFGMFIHFGLYAIPARGEWVRYFENISNEDYQKYFDEFNPVNYNPREWAKVAKAAGMKYAIMTAKHHDGFCLFDSKLTEYKSTNTPFGRDLIKEYVEAFREEGLGVGLYYSMVDWHHEHYPAYGDKFHPMRNNEEYKDQERDFSKYIEYYHGQVRELLTNYGKVDLLWFDFSYGEMRGEAWKASDLVRMIRSLQPDILINNRLGGNIRSVDPEIYAGDYYTPEEYSPPEVLLDESGNPIPWEACVTLNNNWGYAPYNRYKSVRQVITGIADSISKNGNIILNINPNAKGEIPDEVLGILSETGKWMRKNHKSVYGCEASEFPRPDWGCLTQKGNKLYVHIFNIGLGPMAIKGLVGKVKKARLLSDGSEVIVGRPSWIKPDVFTDYEFFCFFVNSVSYDYSISPDDIDAVVEIELFPESGDCR